MRLAVVQRTIEYWGNSQRIIILKSISSGNSFGFSRPILLRFGVLNRHIATYSGATKKLEKPYQLKVVDLLGSPLPSGKA